MERLKVVQIGGEHDHASDVIKAMRRQDDLFELAGYVIPEDDASEQFADVKQAFDGVRRLTLEEALATPGLQGAVIETSEKKLTKYARIAAEHGLAVHMDKPGGDVEGEYQSLIAYVKERRNVFSLGYMYRFNPAVRRMFEMRDNGELGEIISVEAQMNCLHPPKKRDWLKKYRGGMMFFLGCHLIDLIMQMQGEPQEIMPFNRCTGLDGVCGEDFGMALLRYERGWSFAKTSAVELGGFMRRQLVVCGTKATVELNPIEYIVTGDKVNNQCTDMFVTTAEDCAQRSWNARGEKVVYGPVNRYDDMMRAFAEAALGRRPSPVDYDYEVKLHRAILAASGINQTYIAGIEE